MNAKAKPARLDPNGTEKPLTQIIHHPLVGICVGPSSVLQNPELETVETKERIKLTEDSKLKRFVKRIPDRNRPAPMFEIVGMNPVETRVLEAIIRNNLSDSEDYKVLRAANLVTGRAIPDGCPEGKGFGLLEFWCKDNAKVEKAVEYIESQLEDPKRLALMQSLIDAGI